MTRKPATKARLGLNEGILDKTTVGFCDEEIGMFANVNESDLQGSIFHSLR